MRESTPGVVLVCVVCAWSGVNEHRPPVFIMLLSSEATSLGIDVCVHAVSLCVGIIFVSYALQVKYRPFVDPNLDAASNVAGHTKAIYVRTGVIMPV